MTDFRASCLASLVVLAATVALTGCSSPAAAPGTVVRAQLQDFKIAVRSSHVTPGRVSFQLDNRGPSTHEFNVDRLVHGAPTTTAVGPDDVVPPGLTAAGVSVKSDGLTVDEDAPAFDRAGSLDVVDSGTSATLSLSLKPGTYLLYCNLEGHFLGGMHAVLVVG